MASPGPRTPPPPIISISPPSSTSSSPIQTPIDIADASCESSPPLDTPKSSNEASSNASPTPLRRTIVDDGDSDDEEVWRGLDDGDSADMANATTWAGKAAIRGSTETVRMVLLTFVAIGITFTWGIEMTYCTPYLLNLGLTKSNTSLVWIAGPLSGLCVQPVVGVISDESKSRWGRRRPFMVGGAFVVALSLLVLGFTREIVGLMTTDEEAARRPTIVLAVLAIYTADFGINAVMSCSRSLVVDTLSIDKQQSGAAWLSRMSALGHIIGYGAGALDLVSILGTSLGATQFQQLTVIATLTILGATAITCWAVSERVLLSAAASQHKGAFKVFRQIYATLLHLPPRIRAICWAQFWSWIGWFPFLFYSTTWIGETYFRYDVPAEARASTDALGEIGRIGSTSLVIYSTITFTGAWLLPFLVQSPDDTSYTRRPPKAIAGFLERFNKKKPDLLTTWICGHLLFAASMSMAPFATSYRFATALVCLCGLPWSIAMWAPTTFLGIEVNKLSGGGDHQASYHHISTDDMELNERNSNDTPHRLEDGLITGSPKDSSGELSGVYFGILNIYTTLPQFVGTFISTIVFAIFDPGQSPELSDKPDEHAAKEGPNAIAICLFIGAMSAIVASFVTRRLRVL